MATISANVVEVLALCKQIAAKQVAQDAQFAALQQENADLKAQVAALSTSQGLATAAEVAKVQTTVDAILVDVSESGPTPTGFAVTEEST